MILAFLTVCGIVLGMQVLLPAVFGKNRLLAETYPVLPLLDGADLPGNVLARFDVIWMGFLVFGLLFSGKSFSLRESDCGKNKAWKWTVLDSGSRVDPFALRKKRRRDRKVLWMVSGIYFCAAASCDPDFSQCGK